MVRYATQLTSYLKLTGLKVEALLLIAFAKIQENEQPLTGHMYPGLRKPRMLIIKVGNKNFLEHSME